MAFHFLHLLNLQCINILNQWASFNINKEVKFETGSSENTDMKSMLTVVLDLNGLLLKRGFQPSAMHQSTLYAPNKYFIL